VKNGVEKGTSFLLQRQATLAWWARCRSGLSVSVESQALPGTRVVWMKEEAQSE